MHLLSESRVWQQPSFAQAASTEAKRDLHQANGERRDLHQAKAVEEAAVDVFSLLVLALVTQTNPLMENRAPQEVLRTKVRPAPL